MKLDSVRISFVYDPQDSNLAALMEDAIENIQTAYGGNWHLEETSEVGEGLVEVTLVAGGEAGYVLPKTDNVTGAAMTLLEDLGYVVGSPGYNEYYPAVVRHLRRLAVGEESEAPTFGGVK